MVGDNSDECPFVFIDSIDSDKDGVCDNSDPFPDNPNEWKDSDNDGYGDNSDAYPEDPNRSLKESKVDYQGPVEGNTLDSLLILIVVVGMAFFIFKSYFK